MRCEGVIRGGASDRGYVGLWVLVLPLWFDVILVDGYRCALCVVAGAVKVRREVEIEIGGWMFLIEIEKIGSARWFVMRRVLCLWMRWLMESVSA